MSTILMEILVILLLTMLNGVLSMSEIAVVSARKTRLEQWAEAGNRRARFALDVANAPQDFLSTVQVGITLVGVMAGAFGGATIAQKIAGGIAAYPAVAPHAETIALGLVVLGITYLSLILGELVPKRIALNNPEAVATVVAGTVRGISRVFTPVVWVLSVSTNTLLSIFGVHRASEPSITEDEIRILVRQGSEGGTINVGDRNMIERVFRLGTRSASTMMTPRTDLVVLNISDSLPEIRDKVFRSGHSYFPLCAESSDDIIGIVGIRDLFSQIALGQPPDLKAVAREALFLPESIRGPKLLEQLKRSDTQIAILLDEHGGVKGLITVTDILEALVGELSVLTAPKMVRRGDGSWLIDGMLSIAEFRETLKTGKLPGESRAYETVGGFMLYLFGRIPAEGDAIQWKHYRLEIVDMDGHRIDKILAIPSK